MVDYFLLLLLLCWIIVMWPTFLLGWNFSSLILLLLPLRASSFHNFDSRLSEFRSLVSFFHNQFSAMTLLGKQTLSSFSEADLRLNLSFSRQQPWQWKSALNCQIATRVILQVPSFAVQIQFCHNGLDFIFGEGTNQKPLCCYVHGFEFFAWAFPSFRFAPLL